MPNLPYIAPMSPETSVRAASTGASMGNLVADNRLRAASLAQQAMQHSQALELSRIAQEAARAEAINDRQFKAEQSADDFQQRLTLQSMAMKGQKELALMHEEFGVKQLEAKARITADLNTARYKGIVESLKGRTKYDLALVMDEKRSAAARKALDGMRWKETGLLAAKEAMKALPNYSPEGDDAKKLELEIAKLSAQRTFLEQSLLGVPENDGEQPPSVIGPDGKRHIYKTNAERDAAVEGMKGADPSRQAAPILTFNIRENRYD